MGTYSSLNFKYIPSITRIAYPHLTRVDIYIQFVINVAYNKY